MFHAPECVRDRIFSSETRGIESDPEKTTDARWALEARNKSMGVVKDHVTHLGPRTSSHHGILHAGADRAVISRSRKMYLVSVCKCRQWRVRTPGCSQPVNDARLAHVTRIRS